MENQLPEPSYISLHLSTKGKYSWDIKFNLIYKFAQTKNGYAQVEDADATIEALKYTDAQLREKFPNNTAELKNSGRFGAFSTDEA